MPAFPDPNSGKAPLVRLVLPGLFCVTLSSTASFLRNERVSTFFGELMLHLPAAFQSPPLLTIQMENSAGAPSGPSGNAYPTMPLPRAAIFLASVSNSAQVVGGLVMPALVNSSLL